MSRFCNVHVVGGHIAISATGNRKLIGRRKLKSKGLLRGTFIIIDEYLNLDA